MINLTGIFCINNLLIISLLICITFALLMVQISFTKFMKTKEKKLLIPFANGVLYIFMNIDWLITQQTLEVGYLRDIIWNIIELCFIYIIIILIKDNY
ncbi:MAG: hypothetical protein PHT94_00815 [Candidatus Nanoarchaeia archaeon]|nr:hypothetical protein [Candidatus Nanoarchaeia archaeon]